MCRHSSDAAWSNKAVADAVDEDVTSTAASHEHVQLHRSAAMSANAPGEAADSIDLVAGKAEASGNLSAMSEDMLLQDPASSSADAIIDSMLSELVSEAVSQAAICADCQHAANSSGAHAPTGSAGEPSDIGTAAVNHSAVLDGHQVEPVMRRPLQQDAALQDIAQQPLEGPLPQEASEEPAMTQPAPCDHESSQQAGYATELKQNILHMHPTLADMHCICCCYCCHYHHCL